MSTIIGGPNAGRHVTSFWMRYGRRATFAEKWKIAKDAVQRGEVKWPGVFTIWFCEPWWWDDNGKVGGWNS